MSCKGVHEESYFVIVKHEARREIFCCGCFTCVTILILLFVPLFFILGDCGIPPSIALQDFTIHDMVVVQSFITYPNSSKISQWQVTSDINVTLSMKNANTVAGCFATFRRMEVSVTHRDHLISTADIPLGFALKPGRSRAVSAEVKGEHFQVPNELGPVLDAELQSSNVTLVLQIDSRYLRALDRKSKWDHWVCQVVVKTPLESASRVGSLLHKDCS